MVAQKIAMARNVSRESMPLRDDDGLARVQFLRIQPRVGREQGVQADGRFSRDAGQRLVWLHDMHMLGGVRSGGGHRG